MERRVHKWGNSLAVPIPADIARETRVRDGTAVDVGLEDGVIVIRRLGRDAGRRDLASLVARITDDNRHGETDVGRSAGRETW